MDQRCFVRNFNKFEPNAGVKFSESNRCISGALNTAKNAFRPRLRLIPTGELTALPGS